MNRPVSSDLVVETLLKTNRPPTDEEKAIIQGSIAPTNAKLRVVEAQISETMAHLQGLKAHAEQAEQKLQYLREKAAAIVKTSEDYCRVLSAVRYLPEDVLREIFISCVEGTIPVLSYRETSLPYVLAQISSGIRRIVLTTPIIWARMDVPSYFLDHRLSKKAVYLTLSRRAIEWFKRADVLPLTLFISDPSFPYQRLEDEDEDPDPSDILFNALLSYSARWKEITFKSSCDYLSTPMIRIAALIAIDIPLLELVSLDLEHSVPQSAFTNTGFLTFRTLKHVTLLTDNHRKISVNWTGLTSLVLNAKWDTFCFSMNELAGILQQTKRLTFCDIYFAGWYRTGDRLYLDNISLPFLETWYITDRTFGEPSSGTPSLIDLTTAPALKTLGISQIFLTSSLSDFLQRSPKIWKLSLPYVLEDVSFTNTIEFLRHCPSLTVLSLHPPGWHEHIQQSNPDANMLMRAFVEGGDVGILCPLLQYINFRGEIDFSLKTLEMFLEAKRGWTSVQNVLPWKRVIIDIRGIQDVEKCEQVLDLVAEKKAEGLDIDAFLEKEALSKDKHFYE